MAMLAIQARTENLEHTAKPIITNGKSHFMLHLRCNFMKSDHVFDSFQI